MSNWVCLHNKIYSIILKPKKDTLLSYIAIYYEKSDEWLGLVT